MIALFLLGLLLGIAGMGFINAPLYRKAEQQRQADGVVAKDRSKRDAKRREVLSQMEYNENPYVCPTCDRIGSGMVQLQISDYETDDGTGRISEQTYWLACKCGADIKQVAWPEGG